LSRRTGLVNQQTITFEPTLQKWAVSSIFLVRFYAKTQQIDQITDGVERLISIEDVTLRVTSALKPGMTERSGFQRAQRGHRCIEKEVKIKPD